MGGKIYSVVYSFCLKVMAVELVFLVMSLDRLQEHITRIEWIWREKLLGEEEGVETMQVRVGEEEGVETMHVRVGEEEGVETMQVKVG